MTRAWLLACTAAEGLGMTAAVAAATIASRALDGRPAAGLAVVVLGGLVEGAALGVLTARALPAGVTARARRRFAAATVAVAGLGWAAASAPAALAGDEGGPEPSLALVLLGAAGLGAVMGALLGLAQAWAVRADRALPGAWVAGSTLGWAAAMPVIFAGATRAGADWPWPAVAALGTGTGLAAGAVLGLVTARWLPRLAPPARGSGTLVPKVRAHQQ